MKTNLAARHLIMRNEGCVLHPYHDSVGVLTIGYGHTGDDIDGPITQAVAEHLLAQDLAKFEEGVEDLIGGAETTENQFGAMVSLAYNVGLGNFKKSSVLRQHIAGDYDAAAEAFSLWNKAGGVVLAGLSRRRAEEAELYETDDGPTPALLKSVSLLKRLFGR